MTKQALGKHILVEFYNCPCEILNDVVRIEKCMLRAAKEAEATIINSAFHHFSPFGVSGVVVIQESHLAIHTWPEFGYVALDIFTCGETVDPWIAYDVLIKDLQAEHGSAMQISRGQLQLLSKQNNVPNQQEILEERSKHVRNIWFTERGENMSVSFRHSGDVVFREKSQYQKVEVYDTYAYGKMLTIDGLVMCTEKDEHGYHEMITHVPMLTHPNPKNVLVIGGGDGGTIREITRYQDLEKVTLVEIDQVVIDAAKKHLPTISGAFDHPKLELHVADGIEFIRSAQKGTYDIIIVDSSEPCGPSEGLFTEDFYRNAYNALCDDGILVTQSESPRFNTTVFCELYDCYRKIFGNDKVHCYLAFIPTYNSGMWSFSYSSKGNIHPLQSFKEEEYQKLISNNALQYYNKEVHQAAFALPNFVRNMLKIPRQVEEKVMAKTHTWGVQDSEKLFSIKEWGEGYFSVNDKGHIAVCPQGNSSPSIDLMDVVNELELSHNNIFPIAIRCTDILRNQAQRLRKSFQETIHESEYQGKYFGVYPIKVNQLCGVVEEIANSGCQMGLEAGSKAELLAILSVSTTEDAVTVLNGYKNEDYMKMAFIGCKLKNNLIVVIEKLSEIHSFLKLAREHTAIPALGVRVKLTTESSGKWRESSGFNSKFGLATSEILMLIDLLREHGLLHKLKLIHFHLGSQIPNIHTLKESIIEGARVYSHLKKLCPQLEYINTGGGLGIDYDGSATANNSSRNYKLKEYTDNIVQGIMQICDEEDVPHPHIITENGRALTAHHSCIVTNIVNQIQTNSDFDLSVEEEENALLQNIRDVLDSIQEDYRVQFLHDATNLYQHSLQAFKMGILSITERAKIEAIYLKILQEVSQQNALQKENKNLPLLLSSHYICNFSVFQSVIDHWAIEQLIPIVPIQRLHERPTNYSMLADITCDSDGKIKKYVTKNSNKNHIPLHNISNQEKYLLGIFLTGAYQDVMGDNHNLLGRINQVYISYDETAEKNFRIDRYVKGSSVKDLLKIMHYDTKNLQQKLREKITQKYHDSSHLQDYLDFCSTYLEDSTYI